MSDYIGNAFLNTRLKAYFEDDPTISDEIIAFCWIDAHVVRIKERRIFPRCPYRYWIDPASKICYDPLFDPLDGDPDVYWPRRIKTRIEMENFLFLADHIYHIILCDEMFYIDECAKLGCGQLGVFVRPGKTASMKDVNQRIYGALEQVGFHDFVTCIGLGLSICFQNHLDEKNGEGKFMFLLLAYCNFAPIEEEKVWPKYTEHETCKPTTYSVGRRKKIQLEIPHRLNLDYFDCGNIGEHFMIGKSWEISMKEKKYCFPDLPAWQGVRLICGSKKEFESGSEILVVNNRFDSEWYYNQSREDQIWQDLNLLMEGMDNKFDALNSSSEIEDLENSDYQIISDARIENYLIIKEDKVKEIDDKNCNNKLMFKGLNQKQNIKSKTKSRYAATKCHQKSQAMIMGLEYINIQESKTHEQEVVIEDDRQPVDAITLSNTLIDLSYKVNDFSTEAKQLNNIAKDDLHNEKTSKKSNNNTSKSEKMKKKIRSKVSSNVKSKTFSKLSPLSTRESNFLQQDLQSNKQALQILIQEALESIMSNYLNNN
jgi:hypothetical protein